MRPLGNRDNRRRLVPALGVLAALIGLALAFLIWKDGSGERSRDAGRIETPAGSPRNPGASTLSHGGPTPSQRPRDHESGLVPGPFLEPDYRTPHETSGSQKAGRAPAANRSPRTDGAGRGSGDQGP